MEFKLNFISILINRISQFWKGYNIFGRFFWTVVLTASCYGMSVFGFYTFQRYFSEPVGITVDTEYTHWNFSFPAVSICLIKGKSSQPLVAALEKLNFTNVRGILRHIHICMFVVPNQMDTLVTCDEMYTKHGIDLDVLKELVFPKSCNEFLDLVYYNEKQQNCDDIFKFHKTEMGHCFIANSILDYGYSFDNLKLKYQLWTANKRLTMRLKVFKVWQYAIYVHSPEELPFSNSISKEIFTTELLYSYNVDKILTDADAGRESIHERGCRYPHEKLDGSPFHYSFSSCISYLRIQSELQECNCTHSTSPDSYRSQYCDLTGIMCLMNGNINAIARQLAMETNICVPSCIEQILRYTGQSELSSEISSTYTDVSIEVANFPFARYIRSLTLTKLDLAVSIAGLAGLFFGASVLNFVEVLYYLATGK